MNARMRLVAQEQGTLFVVSAMDAGGRGPLETVKWTWLEKKLKRNAAALTIAHSFFPLGASQTQSARKTATERCFQLAGPPEQ
jgi:hypothetical protein